MKSVAPFALALAAGLCFSQLHATQHSPSSCEGQDPSCRADVAASVAPGTEVINAILADMWPGLSNSLLAKMRTNPKLIDPYLLQLREGKFRYSPKIQNIKLISTPVSHDPDVGGNDQPSTPPRFECSILYKGRPDIDFVLTGADGKKAPVKKRVAGIVKRMMRKLVPDILIEINSIDLHARLEVELDMRKKTVVFFFLDRPDVEWDLEFSLTKAHIPLVGEDSLDTILTSVLAGIDRDHPIRIKF